MLEDIRSRLTEIKGRLEQARTDIVCLEEERQLLIKQMRQDCGHDDIVEADAEFPDEDCPDGRFLMLHRLCVNCGLMQSMASDGEPWQALFKKKRPVRRIIDYDIFSQLMKQVEF